MNPSAAKKPTTPVLIQEETLARMRRHAAREYPLECCGLLAGRGKVIDEIFPAENLMLSRTAFQVPLWQLIAVMKAIRRDSKELMGIYHSHPESPARPSDKDAAEFYYREATYWILSMQTDPPDVRCWLWRDGRFREAPYRTVRKRAV